MMKSMDTTTSTTKEHLQSTHPRRLIINRTASRQDLLRNTRARRRHGRIVDVCVKALTKDRTRLAAPRGQTTPNRTSTHRKRVWPWPPPMRSSSYRSRGAAPIAIQRPLRRPQLQVFPPSRSRRKLLARQRQHQGQRRYHRLRQRLQRLVPRLRLPRHRLLRHHRLQSYQRQRRTTQRQRQRPRHRQRRRLQSLRMKRNKSMPLLDKTAQMMLTLRSATLTKITRTLVSRGLTTRRLRLVLRPQHLQTSKRTSQPPRHL
mmetsp:Transcript_8540/g.20689  ORF Transcript_8540/g.20689 Transcript_8540/m.20689 type:complete len:259 (-) Transcript_8540:933-1709(-)